MKKTQLVEFKNTDNDTLRGILVTDKTSENVVLMCGGFERSATTEKKFKTLADQLINEGFPSLRFDFSGCGLSDGDFSKITVKRMVEEIKNANEFLINKTKSDQVIIVSHSLSACAIALLANEQLFKKIILIAPALNQKDLLRYWFVIGQMKKKNPETEISWANFKNFINEDEFQTDRQQEKMTKENYLSPAYFQENQDTDYSKLVQNTDNILQIHGENDDKVPPLSLNVTFKNKTIVPKGDHDLEKPDIINQWLPKVIKFIKN